MMMKDTVMQVTVTGPHTKGEKNVLETAARFFAERLMDPRMVRNLTIDIEISANSEVQGECADEDGCKNPRWFTIGLLKQNLDDMIRTLGHEMVHVKQSAKNELRCGDATPARGGQDIQLLWMGKPWKPTAKEDAYFDAPWEIEAYGREVGLFQKWVAFNAE